MQTVIRETDVYGAASLKKKDTATDWIEVCPTIDSEPTRVVEDSLEPILPLPSLISTMCFCTVKNIIADICLNFLPHEFQEIATFMCSRHFQVLERRRNTSSTVAFKTVPCMFQCPMITASWNELLYLMCINQIILNEVSLTWQWSEVYLFPQQGVQSFPSAFL